MSFLTLDTLQLYYETVGSGSALVFLHDGLAHSVVWDAQVAAFAGAYQVIRYDRRGYGRSDVPTQPYSNLDDLYALVRHLNVPSATLIGSSIAGGLALDFAVAHPQLVHRLVLVGPVLNGFGFSDHFIERGRALLHPLIENHDVAAAIERRVNDPYIIAGPNTAARAQLRTWSIENPQNVTNPVHFAERPQPPTRAQLMALQTPTLVLVGEADIPDVHAHAGAIHFALPRAQRIVLQHAGHLPYVEQPEAFNKLVYTFLAE